MSDLLNEPRPEPQHRETAVVLQVRPYGDTDAVVPMYGERHGRFTCFFRHLRSSKKKKDKLTLRPGFVISLELERRPGSDLYQANAVDIVTTHLGLANDLPRLAALSLLMEAYRDSFRDGEADPDAFALLLATLDKLATEPPLDVVSAFSRGLIAMLGYQAENTPTASVRELLKQHEQIVGHSLAAYRFFLDVA